MNRPQFEGQRALTSAIDELAAILPTDRLTTNAASLDGLRRDQTDSLAAGMPCAAAFPITTDEVSAVLRLCSELRVPVVPRGAGSGLAGGANAIDGGLMLSLMRMDRIGSVDGDDLSVVVQPGAINARVAAAAADAGLFFAPDPSSFEISSIGGNLATNAGGLQCLKHGVTRESVLAIEVVLADGSVLRTGHRSLKGVAGYDLVGLFVGSEGTLGVITEATLRLRPMPPTPHAALAAFGTLGAAAEAVRQIGRAGVAPSMLELMDATTVRAIEDWQHLGLDTAAAAVLLICADSEEQLRVVDVACRSAGATDVLAATDARETEGLIAARRAAFPALERQGATLLEDVAVPRSRLLDLVGAIQDIASRRRVLIGSFGHVGDGNLHPTLVWSRGDEAERRRAEAAASDILAATLRLDGTLSGEHGIGLLKRDLLAEEIGPVGMRVSQTIKAALDPLGILNPGKVLPDAGFAP